MVISLASCKVKQLSFMASEEIIALLSFIGSFVVSDLVVTRNLYQDSRVVGICKVCTYLVLNFSFDLNCIGGVLDTPLLHLYISID